MYHGVYTSHRETERVCVCTGVLYSALAVFGPVFLLFMLIWQKTKLWIPSDIPVNENGSESDTESPPPPEVLIVMENQDDDSPPGSTRDLLEVNGEITIQLQVQINL